MVRPIGQPRVATDDLNAGGERLSGVYRVPIEAIEPRRLYRQVADQLRVLMDRGEFAVGARLPSERELALQFGISRATVREALIALEVDGRVRIRVGSGVYVVAPTGESDSTTPPIAGPFDVLGARVLFEGSIAEEAARRAAPADLAAIDETIALMAASSHPGPETTSLDRAFHIAIAQILGNDAVTKVVGDLFDQRNHPYFAQLARHFENPESWRRALAEHRLIRDAIAAGDPAAACAAMRTHLTNSQARFSESFAKGPASEPEGVLVRVGQPARRYATAP